MNGLLALGVSVFIGVGVGALVVPPRPAHWPRAGWLSLTGLVGLLCLAMSSNALCVLGVPRAVVLVCVYGAAALGWILWCRRPRAATLVPPREEGTILLLVLLLTFVPWAAALAGLTFTNDAAVIWYPKILEILHGVVPSARQIALAWPTHGHPEYPRGFAWLAALGDPAASADPTIPQAVSLLFPTLGALLLAGWFLARRRLGWAALATVLFLALPEVAYQMALGMADLPLSIAILATVMGLAWAGGADPDVAGPNSVRFGRLLAAVGAAAAASIKQEGAVIAGAVAVWVCLGIVRGPRADRRHWLLCLAILATIAPWWSLRAKGEGEVLQNFGLLAKPMYVVDRVGLLAEKLYFQMVDLERFDPHGLDNARIPAVAWVLSLGLVFLFLFRRRPVPVWPVAMLLLADLAIYVISFHDLTWHLLTSADRVWMQLSPALILAILAAADAALSLPATRPGDVRGASRDDASRPATRPAGC